MASKRVREKVSTTPIEIVRSFSFKLNCGTYPGGAQYESMDFFSSQKATCLPAEAEKVSEGLFQFCRKEVLRAVNAHIRALADGTWKKAIDTHQAAKANAREYEKRTAERDMPRNHARALEAPALTPEVIAHAMAGADGTHTDAYRK